MRALTECSWCSQVSKWGSYKSREASKNWSTAAPSCPSHFIQCCSWQSVFHLLQHLKSWAWFSIRLPLWLPHHQCVPAPASIVFPDFYLCPGASCCWGARYRFCPLPILLWSQHRGCAGFSSSSAKLKSGKFLPSYLTFGAHFKLIACGSFLGQVTPRKSELTARSGLCLCCKMSFTLWFASCCSLFWGFGLKGCWKGLDLGSEAFGQCSQAQDSQDFWGRFKSLTQWSCGSLPTQDSLSILTSLFSYPINLLCSCPVTALDFQSLHFYLSDLPRYNVVIHLLKTHTRWSFKDVTLPANTLGLLHKVGLIINADYGR